jgi:dinuclear metal center YbgI/SA1388 family protein
VKSIGPTIQQITRFLNTELGVRHIADASKNGLQVRSRKSGAIRTVGFAVDACVSTFKKAKQQGVELLVVHHGIAWRPQKDRELEALRRAFLLKNDIALYAVHLPLDLHREYGNNAELARIMGMQNLKKFGRYHGIMLGYSGRLRKPVPLQSVAAGLDVQLGSTSQVYQFGRQRVSTIGVISGGGGSMLKDAVQLKLDCFVVGEIDLAVHNAAQEYGMNLIAAGHYATETVGVKALMPAVAERFGVKTVFIDDPKDL